MPIYEYECRKCQAVTEALRSMRDADKPQACEACGSKQTKRKQSEFAAGGSTAGEHALPMGGCGRCGDPNGSCGLN